MYHTATAFEVVDQGVAQNYTMEFDATEGVAQFAPYISPDGQFHFKNGARYCLTEGLKFNASHWTQRGPKGLRFTIKPVLKVRGEHLNRLASDFMPRYNHSVLYQLFRLKGKEAGAPDRIEDTTCSTGAQFMLEYLSNISDSGTFPLMNASRATLHAATATKVNASDPAVHAELLSFYQTLNDVIQGPPIGSKEKRLFEFIALMRGHKFVYSQGEYWQLSDFYSPYIWSEYVAAPDPFPLPSSPQSMPIVEDEAH